MPYLVPDFRALWGAYMPQALCVLYAAEAWERPMFKMRRWLAVFRKSNADKLIKDEIKSVFAVDRWCMRRMKSHALKVDSVEQFVRRVYELHEDEIKRWKGWRFAGQPVEMADLNNAQVAHAEVVADICNSKAAKDVIRKMRDAGYRPHFEMFGQCSIGDRLSSILLSKTIPEQINRKMILSKETRVQAAAFYAEALHYYSSSAGGPGTLQGTYSEENKAIQKACYAATRQKAIFRPGERVAPALLEVIHKHFGEVLPEFCSLYEKLIQLCGERVWSMQSRPVHPLVSVAPSDFLMIGNSRFDADSCFRTKGMNGNHKIQLAARLEHSFSLWFARGKDAKEKIRVNRYGMPAREKIVGRGWGMSLLPAGVVATNFYGLLAADLRPVYTPMLEQAFGLQLNKQMTGSVSSARSDWYSSFSGFLNPIIYFNADADFLLAKGADMKDFPAQLQRQLHLPKAGETDPFACRNR